MLTPEEEVELFLKEKSECYKRTKVSIMDDTLEGFHQGRNESYRTPEDRLDVGVALPTLQVTDNVVDLLKGGIKKEMAKEVWELVKCKHRKSVLKIKKAKIGLSGLI